MLILDNFLRVEIRSEVVGKEVRKTFLPRPVRCQQTLSCVRVDPFSEIKAQR